jgi:hypothetical protein
VKLAPFYPGADSQDRQRILSSGWRLAGARTRFPRRVGPVPEPHYFGRRSKRCREFVEVGVCAYDDEPFLLGESPDLSIRVGQQIEVRDVSGIRVQFSQTHDKLA